MDLRQALEKETIARVGYRDPVTVEQKVTVRMAIDHMREKKVGCLLVLKEDRLAGIFTERDLITQVLGKEGTLDISIAKFMTLDPIVARSNDPICSVLARMYEGGMRHLPVLDENDRPVGTISVKSALRFLTDHHQTTVYNLPPDPHQFPSSREGG